jgi:hypothetical protein
MEIHLLPSKGDSVPQSNSSSIVNQVDNRIEGRLALITGASGGYELPYALYHPQFHISSSITPINPTMAVFQLKLHISIASAQHVPETWPPKVSTSH